MKKRIFAVKYRFLAKNPVKSSELIQCKKGRFRNPAFFDMSHLFIYAGRAAKI
ncbi:hypothetical protein CHCC14821_1340 [Bacillus paralicheniformis]|nr:hypothetical protein CHCC14821_1340 [Bacillus paralicheniformis]